MKTVVLEQPGKLALHEVPLPTVLNGGEALVRVHRVGICGTDLHAFEGSQPFFTYPRVLGHELAVEIVDAGRSQLPDGLAVGEICALNPYLECGTCIACRRGRPNACVRLQVMGVHRDGGMAEYLVVPVKKLHRAYGLPLEAAALVEMFSVGAHAVRRAAIDSNTTVLVIGAGPIGLGTMQFARLCGAPVIAMDTNPTRLAFCRKQLGIDHAIDARNNALEQLQTILNGELPIAVFDATGNTQSMINAFQYVAHGGRLIYVGITREHISFSDPHFHSREMTLYASRNATNDDFAWVLESMSKDLIAIDGWITHRVTPEDMITDFGTWLEPETAVLKAMLYF
ncbi:MAG: zinc-binding alcohol dehydrogenase family protein [Anaerolineae bacterium]